MVEFQHGLVWPSLVVLFLSARKVSGHGHMLSPRSRNVYAHNEGLDFGTEKGVPAREYCHYCLNRNNGVCGNSGSHDYDLWRDSTGLPMEWNPQAVYQAGSILRIQTELTTHHGGHMEVKVCPDGRNTTQACLDENVLTFVRDIRYGMPLDLAHPERGYYSGWNSGQTMFEMEFQLPSDLAGEQVLVQWQYITANSCSPEGYAAYFQGANTVNRVLPAGFWADRLSPCQLPYPSDGTTGRGWPEQFFNCAEISIVASNGKEQPPTTSTSDTTTPEGNPSTGGGEEPVVTTNPPSVVPVVSTLAPTEKLTKLGPRTDSRMIAFMDTHLACPSEAQMAQYSHVVIQRASILETNGDENCSCDILTPNICNNAANDELISNLQNENRRVLLGFYSQCWNSCAQDATATRLVQIVEELNLDGVSIEYSEELALAATGGGLADVMELTSELRSALPFGALVVHAPSQSLVELYSSLYFGMLHNISHELDFVLPQYNNLESFSDVSNGYQALVTEIFGGDATRVTIGFCLRGCADATNDPAQATAVVRSLGETQDCYGGVSFRPVASDNNGDWSSAVNMAMDPNRECSGGVVVVNRVNEPENTAASCCPIGHTGMKATEDCTQFFHCVGGRLIGLLLPCAEGTLFDEKAQICNWLEAVTCEANSCDFGVPGSNNVPPPEPAPEPSYASSPAPIDDTPLDTAPPAPASSAATGAPFVVATASPVFVAPVLPPLNAAPAFQTESAARRQAQFSWLTVGILCFVSTVWTVVGRRKLAT